MASAAEMLVGGAVLLLGSLLSGERMTQVPKCCRLGRVGLVFFGSILAFSAYMYLLARAPGSCHQLRLRQPGRGGAVGDPVCR